MDPDMTFTRIDKSKGFYPENCSWLTKSEASKINADFMKKNGRLIGRKRQYQTLINETKTGSPFRLPASIPQPPQNRSVNILRSDTASR